MSTTLFKSVLNSRTIFFAAVAANISPALADGVATTKAAAASPFAVLLLQIIVVVGVAKIVGRLFAMLQQPAVVGEMLAGILLGPSLLGHLFPDVQAALFPASSLSTLQLLSQLGVVLFMFFVGLELDLQRLQQYLRTAVLVSASSILAPFALGIVLAFFIYENLATASTSTYAFSLFMATALSVTAFPVLARILAERNLTQTKLGQTVIACAAIADISAWSLLAIVVAIAQSSSVSHALLTILLTAIFLIAMLLLKPRLNHFLTTYSPAQNGERNLVGIVLLFVFLCALLTEKIGIHAIFGAFLAGAIMPPQAHISRVLHERIETFASSFLLPLFFAFTGLRTEIGTLNTGSDWLICAVIIGVAIAGKFGGSYIAARWSGLEKKEAASIGILMNTRGLIEVVVLNLGYDLGILSPRAFTMMVIMALVTTLMTAPCLDLLERFSRSRIKKAADAIVQR